MTAKVPDRPNTGYFAKEDFRIDLETMTCSCPAGQECRTVTPNGRRQDREGNDVQLQAFHFDPAVCDACPMRPQCVKTEPGKGRTVTIHPQERLLQEARAFQKSEAFGPYRKSRQAAEHRIARLMQLGMRQARYFGRTKTLFQLLLAATVANLTLVATKVGLMRARGSKKAHLFAHSVVRLVALTIGFILSFAISSSLTRLRCPQRRVAGWASRPSQREIDALARATRVKDGREGGRPRLSQPP